MLKFKPNLGRYLFSALFAYLLFVKISDPYETIKSLDPIAGSKQFAAIIFLLIIIVEVTVVFILLFKSTKSHIAFGLVISICIVGMSIDLITYYFDIPCSCACFGSEKPINSLPNLLSMIFKKLSIGFGAVYFLIDSMQRTEKKDFS